MARTPNSHAARAREDDDDDDDIQLLFLLPNGEPASFLLHNFEDASMIRRITEHGGRITDDDTTADVVLTKSREEYKTLKDRYAISRRTYVRLSGFVDRCINSHRFQLAPTVEKGVPGRKLGSRRTEFTKSDDENLCQYIAEVLPDKAEGGRTGHFIYTDLIRRANEFGQYSWALRHPKDAWRERYRRNQPRMDKRINEIVKESPTSLDGKGLYKFRRYGRIDQDDDDEFVDMDEEERRDSATDNEDGPVQTKKADAQRQEEEEEEEDEGQVVLPWPGSGSDLRSREAERQEEEGTEEQTAEVQPETSPRTRMATRRSRVSLGEAPGPKRRRTRAPHAVLEEPSNPDDLDATLRGDADVGYDKLAEEPEPSPPPPIEAEIGKGKKKRTRPRTRQVVPPLSPRRTRARSRSQSVQAEPVPAASSRTTSRAKAKAIAATETAATAGLEPVPESQVYDEFLALSDGDDEGEMHEVEANLHVSAQSRESPAEDLLPSQSTDPARDDLDDSDSDDEELLAYVKKLEVRLPTVGQNRGGKGHRDRGSSSEEIFPSPDTRAGAEKKRLTQAAKAAPYVPPRGTRAASMIEKEGALARQAAATVVRRR